MSTAVAEALGVRAYAKQRGVSHVAVIKAIKTGRLTRSITRDSRGNPAIDPALADLEWTANTDPLQQRDPAMLGGVKSPNPIAGQQHLFGQQQPKGITSEVAQNFLIARATTETFKAKRAKLAFERDSGKMVDSDVVAAEAFKTARTVRDRMLAIPQSLSTKLAGMKDPREIAELLRSSINSALDILCDEARSGG